MNPLAKPLQGLVGGPVMVPGQDIEYVPNLSSGPVSSSVKWAAVSPSPSFRGVACGTVGMCTESRKFCPVCISWQNGSRSISANSRRRKPPPRKLRFEFWVLSLTPGERLVLNAPKCLWLPGSKRRNKRDRDARWRQQQRSDRS
jgi:hypothetical protein